MVLFKKKTNKKSQVRKGKTLHCVRCSKDTNKLYSWRGFHFCLDCKGQLESGKTA
jgi:hypothetical protein